MKNIVILGATGSIGTSAIDIIQRFPDDFKVVGLTAKSNTKRLSELIKMVRPDVVALEDESAANTLSKQLQSSKTEVLVGQEGIIEIAKLTNADLVISAIVGAAGLLPTLSAIAAGKQVAIANKEPLVMAGELIQQEAAKQDVDLLPIDSEHSAIFQVLKGERTQDIKRIILTASGGPLREMTVAQKRNVSPKEALAHPNWVMGPKISIDSATLMNKGLEVIEARWLFDLPSEKIDVIIHPQSIIHSMVEFVDRSVVAQLGLPDMRGPISYVLHYPKRAPLALPSLDFAALGTLTFQAPDFERFPLLKTAFEVLEVGGTLPAVFNGANEEAVQAFLQEEIPFLDIESVIQNTVSAHSSQPAASLDLILESDRWARDEAKRQIRKYRTL